MWWIEYLPSISDFFRCKNWKSFQKLFKKTNSLRKIYFIRHSPKQRKEILGDLIIYLSHNKVPHVCQEIMLESQIYESWYFTDFAQKNSLKLEWTTLSSDSIGWMFLRKNLAGADWESLYGGFMRRDQLSWKDVYMND